MSKPGLARSNVILVEKPPETAFSKRKSRIHLLGAGQIVSWGSLYYSYPLIAEAMAKELRFSKAEIYGAATLGLLLSSVVAYPMGVAIDRGWGRTVLAGGSVLSAALLLTSAGIQSAWMLYFCIGLLGMAQSMTLYDAVFAVVAASYPSDSVAKITTVTLWGGFASTVFVPFTQMILSNFDWRNTLFILALMNLLMGFLYFQLIETHPGADAPKQWLSSRSHEAVLRAMREPLFWGLLISFTVYYASFSGVTYHLYPLLLERKMTATTAALLIALLGPSQVLARWITSIAGKNRSMVGIGKILMPAFPLSLVAYLFLPGPAGATVFLLIYGIANGIMTIIRATAVPELLGSKAYGAIQGAISLPTTIARAAAPFLVALFWGVSKSYDSVIQGILFLSFVVVGGFWYAVIQNERRRKLDVAFD